MELILNTMRMVDHDQVREHSIGDDASLKQNLAVGIVNPEDYKILISTPSLNLKLSSKYGEVIIKVKEDKDVIRGMILMPVSIWANQITGLEDGELIFKNISLKAISTREPILEFKEIIQKLKEG